MAQIIIAAYSELHSSFTVEYMPNQPTKKERKKVIKTNRPSGVVAADTCPIDRLPVMLGEILVAL